MVWKEIRSHVKMLIGSDQGMIGRYSALILGEPILNLEDQVNIFVFMG
jgi:hypothetical protein